MQKKSEKKKPFKNEKVKVLYQNLNGVWYAFAEYDENVFFSKVTTLDQSAKEIEEKAKSQSKD